MGKQWKQWQTLFSWAPKSQQMVTAAIKLKGACSFNTQIAGIKEKRHHFADKGLYSQSYAFSSSHVRMWELNHKEGWEPKNWCFQTVGLEKTLESPLDSKEIKPVNPKGSQPWIFTGRTEADAESEAPILRPPDAKSSLIGKDPDAEKDWGQREKGVTKDEMVRWHHQLNGHEFKQTLGDSERQGSLVCCMQSMGSWRIDHNLATEQWQCVTF